MAHPTYALRSSSSHLPAAPSTQQGPASSLGQKARPSHRLADIGAFPPQTESASTPGGDAPPLAPIQRKLGIPPQSPAGPSFSAATGVIQCVKGSKFADTTRRKGRVYTIRKRSDNSVVYVGQTDQKLKSRWKQHLRAKPWLDRKKYKIRTKKKGKWSPFEMTAWEQRYIKKYGGVGSLRNRINAMRRKKYLQYAHLHTKQPSLKKAF